MGFWVVVLCVEGSQSCSWWTMKCPSASEISPTAYTYLQMSRPGPEGGVVQAHVHNARSFDWMRSRVCPKKQP